MTRAELLCVMAAILALEHEELEDALNDAFVLEGAVDGMLKALERQPKLSVVPKGAHENE